MSDKYITLHQENHIASIILNRVENDHLRMFSDELFSRCDLINQESEIRAVLVTGTADAFFHPAETMDERIAGKITAALASIKCPVIAAINGDAIGISLEICLACDIRITVDTARFGFTEVSHGDIPHGGGTQRLPRIVGKGKAMELILTARLIDADEAWQIGLVNQVCSADNLRYVTRELAAKLVTKGPVSARYAKEAISKGMDMTLGQGLGLEADLSFLLQSTRDRTEGINAFKEKRPPEFQGE